MLHAHFLCSMMYMMVRMVSSFACSRLSATIQDIVLDGFLIHTKFSVRLLILRSSLSFFLFFFFVLFICFFFVLFFVLIIYYFCIIFLPLPLPLPLVLYSLGPIGKTSGGVQGKWKGPGLPPFYDKPGIRITKVTIYHVLKHFILRMWGKDPINKHNVYSMATLSYRGKKIKEIVEQIVR